MSSRIVRAAFGTCLFVASLPGFALTATKVVPASVPAPAQMRATAQGHALLSNAAPSELFANPDRAYPPSCLSSPLPLHLNNNDPNAVTGLIKLSGDQFSTDIAEQEYVETDAVTIFRVPCAGGKSALLLEIDRPTSLDGNTTTYPVFPLVYVVLSDNTGIVLRLASDPNTFRSDNAAGVPVFTSSVYVIENTYQSQYQFDFNQALSVFVNNLLPQLDPKADTQEFDFAAYNPAQYPAASQPLPISGYLSGNWYDPAHSGEGIQTEIGEIGTATTSRYLTVAWYTYDSSGVPYWLFGSGAFTTGDRSVNVTLAYASNGGFAGNFGSKATITTWGTMVVNFPDCNSMHFTYQTTAVGLPSYVPTGSGAKTWTRSTQLNGLTCQ